MHLGEAKFAVIAKCICLPRAATRALAIAGYGETVERNKGTRGPFWFRIRPVTVVVRLLGGAGDTFLAALTYKYLLEQSMPVAINFAIRASAITVQHIGNYAPIIEEIQ